MIRDVKDVTALLDRRFGSAAGRPLSFVRTLAWVLVGLYLLGLLFPAPKLDVNRTYYNRKMPNTATRDLVVDKNDPRGWVHRKRDPHKFTIAWVGTSTMQNVAPGPYTFIPADVLARIPKIDGKPVRVNMYLFEGGRLMDLYAAIEDALATKPDLVMLDLNPLWLFNDRAIQGWPNLNTAVFNHLLKVPSSWPIVASLYQPSEGALALASSHLSVLRDRWTYANKLRDMIASMTPINPPALPKGPQKRPTGLAFVATMQTPLSFWNYYRPIAPLGPGPLPLQEALIRGSRTDGSLMNDDILGSLFGSLAASKIPSIAYMPPINPVSLAHPGVDAALKRIEAHTAQIAGEHKAKTLLVKSQSAIRVLHGLQFKDIAHMTYSTPMVDYLTNLICSDLNSVSGAHECTPIPKAATR